jgi:hypothetical protein
VSYLLLHAGTWSPATLAPALQAARVEARSILSAKDLVPGERPTVFLLDADSRSAFPLDALRAFVDAGGAIVALSSAGEMDVPEHLPTELLSGFVSHPAGGRQVLVAIRAAYREAAARAETARARNEASLRGREVGELTRIGVAHHGIGRRQPVPRRDQ